MAEIRFVDTTIRDGPQSLWAGQIRIGMLQPALAALDAAGFDAIELMAAAHVKKSVRDLREDPWLMIKTVVAGIRSTPLRLIVGGVNTFGFDAPSMYQLFLDRIAASGVKQARISESWNFLPVWKTRVAAARKAGLEPIINVIYSVSPRHTDAYFAERVRQAASLRPFRLCFKDPGGLLTPERTRALIPIFLQNTDGIPVEIHTHCTTGLGSLCVLEAVKLGITLVNTALPPLADGSSLPSLFNVAKNLRALGHSPMIDEDVLRPVSQHFHAIAREEQLPIGTPAQYDEAQYLHQVPGGMISHLAYQLRQVGMEGKLPETLQETINVRSELGYPIMVTPLSQFVGSQAAINIIVGARYQLVTDQIILYALGRFGEEAAREMNQNVRDIILDRPRAKLLASQEAPHPSLDEMRKKLDAEGLSDEDFLLRWLLTKDDIEAMRAAGPPRVYETRRNYAVGLVTRLVNSANLATIDICRPGFKLSMRCGGHRTN
jgi:oxaloacetate decarboxylase alpha subunit